MSIVDLPLPVELEIDGWEANGIGETNTVYQIRGRYQGVPLLAYLKCSRNSSRYIANEYAVLKALESSGIPAPSVVWVSEERHLLLLEAMDGLMLWDIIDPRREHYRETQVLGALQHYGELLGRIHGLALECALQPRTRLYGLIGEEHVPDARFTILIEWLTTHESAHRDDVFVHGDYNTANVLLCDETVSGIIDWEYAGQGWKEYDLAWALRARRAFLNTQLERDAILQGYCRANQYDPETLRWCEVLNYLHDAYWGRDIHSVATDFSLAKAYELIE